MATYDHEEYEAWLRHRAEVTPVERREHAEASRKAAKWLDSLADRARQRLRVLVIRCPVRGCLLGQIFGLALRQGGEQFLFLGTTLANRRHERFLNWAFTDDWSGPDVWYDVGCRHGTGRLERAWLLDIVGLVRAWHHAMETADKVKANVSEHDRKGITRRVFHPPPQNWRAKKNS